jgi:hypothetical protein
MTMVKITPTDNCPYLIEGPARVVGAPTESSTPTETTTTSPTRPRSSVAAAAAPERNRSATDHQALNYEAASRAPHTLAAIATAS